jgi:hypothetical protein
MSNTPCNRFNSHTLTRDESNWQLANTTKDTALMDDLSNEALSIAGADINVFKLLGVHEQGLMVDLAGSGIAISGGTAQGRSASEAFYNNEACKPWRSIQKGKLDIITNAFIGYNFGVPKLNNGRNRYGPNVDVMQHITTIKLKHGDNPLRRALKMRVERSDDGIKWFGVDIITTLDTSDIQTVNFKQSALARYWRLRPITFTGTDNDFWEISSIQLIDWKQTDVFNVQDDYGWIENRDRDYANTSIKIKGHYDIFNQETDLTLIGFNVNGSYYITANFNAVVSLLGRPIIIGDVLELPSEAQYDPNMNKILKYLEVTDVAWSAEGYTPGWQPTLVRIKAEPMIAKQETMDIVGDFAGAIDKSGLFDVDKSKYSKIGDTSTQVLNAARRDAPLHGADTAEYKTFEQEEIDYYASHNIDVKPLSNNQNALYVEDAIPPNGKPYTEGPQFPPSPKNNDYHRLTYVGLAENVPARLHRYSKSKGRWVYLETDRRAEFNPLRPSSDKLINSVNSISMRNIGK